MSPFAVPSPSSDSRKNLDPFSNFFARYLSKPSFSKVQGCSSKEARMLGDYRHRPKGALSGFCLVLSVTLSLASMAAQRAIGQSSPPRPNQRALTAAPFDSQQPRFKGIWEPANYSQDLRLTDVLFVTTDEGWVSGEKGT